MYTRCDVSHSSGVEAVQVSVALRAPSIYKVPPVGDTTASSMYQVSGDGLKLVPIPAESHEFPTPTPKRAPSEPRHMKKP
jgi:hypothetical protein